MATAPVHTPARFHTPPPLVHIAPRPWVTTYCGKPTESEPKPEAEPTCVMCLSIYEGRRGHPWGTA